MPRYKGAHLTWNDRLTIEKMLREGYSKPQIARYLGVHHSTVYDECRRGAVELKRSDLTTYISYSADVAKDYHLDRKKNMEKPLKIESIPATILFLVFVRPSRRRLKKPFFSSDIWFPLLLSTFSSFCLCHFTVRLHYKMMYILLQVFF